MRSKYLRYRIVCSDSADKLALEVHQFIGAGWEPQGGVCVNTFPDHKNVTGFYQAMVMTTSGASE